MVVPYMVDHTEISEDRTTQGGFQNNPYYWPYMENNVYTIETR